MKQDLKRQLHNLTDHAAKEHAEAQRKHERKVKTLEAEKARPTTLKNQ